jgi:hypothetical protein
MTDELGWKPPAKEAAAEERGRQRRVVRDLLNLDWEQFIGALRLLGMDEGSPEWNDAVEAWRAWQRRRR